MYAYNAEIRYSECDRNGRLKVWNVANHFQDCSIKHSQSLHAGVEELLAARRAWVLARWQIVIDRLPTVGENIRVGTWPTEFNKFIGMRNFVMEDSAGQRIAWADSAWAFIDIDNMRPARAQGFLVDVYTVEPPLDEEYDRSKIKVCGELSGEDSFVAGERYMDTNGHMNNGQYIYKAMEYLPAGMEIRQIRVEYKTAILCDTKVGVKVYSCAKPSSDGCVAEAVPDPQRVVVVFCDENDKNYALIEFSGNNL